LTKHSLNRLTVIIKTKGNFSEQDLLIRADHIDWPYKKPPGKGGLFVSTNKIKSGIKYDYFDIFKISVTILLNCSFGTNPKTARGSPLMGMKTIVGKLRMPKAADSCLDFSVSTL